MEGLCRFRFHFQQWGKWSTMGQCTGLGTGHVFFRIPRAGYVENVRAKTNMKTHPEPPLRVLSGSKTHLELPSDRLTLPLQWRQTQWMSTVRTASTKKDVFQAVQDAAVGVRVRVPVGI